MASNSLESLFLPITWNSSVRILSDDVASKGGFREGAVVGLLYVDSERVARNFGVPIGTRLVDVEGPQGTTVTVRYEDLELSDLD